VKDLYTFKLSSQVHYYTSLPVESFVGNDRNAVVPTNLLSKLLHSSESWQTLEDPNSLLTAIRLCLYIPDRSKYASIKFKDGKDTLLDSASYSVPRWGAIHILNTNDTIEDVVESFLSGFRSALGFEDTFAEIVKSKFSLITSPESKYRLWMSTNWIVWCVTDISKT